MVSPELPLTAQVDKTKVALHFLKIKKTPSFLRKVWCIVQNMTQIKLLKSWEMMHKCREKLNNLQKVKFWDLKVYFAEQGQLGDKMVGEILKWNISDKHPQLSCQAPFLSI